MQKFMNVPPKKEVSKLDKDIGILILTSGKLQDNSDFYAYLSIPPSKYEAYLEAEKRGNFRLEDYATVLHIGKGLEPPADIAKMMQEKYGANPNFENDLIAAMQYELKKLEE